MTCLLPQRCFSNTLSPLANTSFIDQLFEATFPWQLFPKASKEETLPTFRPKLDISSDDKNYTINAEIPGVDTNDMKLEIKDGALILSGEKKTEKTSTDGQTEHVIERSFGSFYRAFTLPEDADSENIQASNKNGILNITIPRMPEKNAKRIQISQS